jgi:hypothetical protein
MKKLFALLAVCAFAATFVACGGQKTENAAEETSTEQPATETVESDTTGVAADTTAQQ